MSLLILLPIVLGFFYGAFIATKKLHSDTELATLAVRLTWTLPLICMATLYFAYGERLTLWTFNSALNLSLKIDALAAIFVVIISFLWPLATLYASKYMTHEGNMRKFFVYYIMTYAVVVGLAFSDNMLTMYLFYESLTFITLPLVVFNSASRSLFAGKKYIIYSVSGAAIGFAGMMVYYAVMGNFDFSQDPIMNFPPNTYLLIAYLLMFVGFAVKTGIFPFHAWLIGAGVAPTPVTALLHAVAVVKAGAFACMRITYYLYDNEYLYGTWVQSAVMSIVLLTIFYGSLTAMRNKHLKRRFAYSTVSQISYILLGVTTMTDAGLIAALMHMVFHIFIKIVIFYTAGNLLFVAHKEYVSETEGMGKPMKFTFILFTINALALVGIPPFGGFSSKFLLAQSALGVGGNIGVVAVVVLLCSALFTAMYLLQISMLAFVPHSDFDEKKIEGVKEAPWQMLYPMAAITLVMIFLSLTSSSLYNTLFYLIMS